jgi:uncharacterized protein YukE
MATLPLTPLALVSTQRTVPSNGSPSSQDYNDDQNDGLIDLTSLVSFINGTLIPLLQVLPSLATAAGLEGRAINTDSTNLTALCFNALTSTPLTIAQSLNYLQNLQTNLQSQITGLSTQVAVLSSQLSSTNQNDISLALQNFQSVLNTTTATLNALQTSVNNNAATTAQVVTPSIAASGSANVVVDWATAFTGNNYTVALSVEDASGFLMIESWSYNTGGVGLTVKVSNTDPAAAHTGTIHAIAIPA